MADWFLGLFEPINVVFFVLGAASATAWHYMWARIRGRVLVIKWAYMVLPLAVIVMLYIAAQTQQSANCIREFQTALTQRSAITTENDEVSVQQRLLMYQWLHEIANPPPEIAALPDGDPRRREYTVRLTHAVDEQMGVLVARQEEYERARAARPLPEPRCGV